jgi:hypothetical protein
MVTDVTLNTLLALIVLFCAILHSQTLTPAWVELGDGGGALARVVVNEVDECPAITIDGTSEPMSARVPVPEGIKPVCEAAIPLTAKAASVNAQKLALPQSGPSRIVVIGDTGCRIKGARVQDCNDPAKWPLQHVSNRAALEKPGLIIHVGDYLYREDRCPQDLGLLCGTSPAGDRWETWQADFFRPAARLLAAAPWAFSRGNHEDCTRAWKGWFYYLDPHPWSNGTCHIYMAPYVINMGPFELVMFDSSGVKETGGEKQVDLFASQLSSVHVKDAWLVDHHPFFALKGNLDGNPPEPLTATLAEAWYRASPTGIRFILSGHTHLFELFSFGPGRPPQLVAGDGGTDLAEKLPAKVEGTSIRGATVVAAASRREFGYTLLTKASNGWDLALKAPLRGTLIACTIRGNQTACVDKAREKKPRHSI